ncbi:MAG: ribokinase [Chloroflexi bacterium]|nr:ribokinase [Chloroflexota bacterium]
MQPTTRPDPIDYLLIGHIARDLTPDGSKLGGTAAYAALTAHALGLRVGVVTSWGDEFPLGPLSKISIANTPTDNSTTFENIYTSEGRLQIIHHVAPSLDFDMIPESWRDAPIVHLGPIAQEVAPTLTRRFPHSLVGVTPQGWLRTWDGNGRVHPSKWSEASLVLKYASAAVISVEDVAEDEERIKEMAAASRIFVVTEGANGSRLYWNGDVRRFRALEVTEVNATGAGDIYAAAFFAWLHKTSDPWEAARFATQLAARSATRSGLRGVPNIEEVQNAMREVL